MTSLLPDVILLKIIKCTFGNMHISKYWHLGPKYCILDIIATGK